MSEIRIIEDVRDGTLGESVEAFLDNLGGPAWFRVAGRDRTRTRAVTTLLHGNEPSGLRAVREWLRSGAVPAVDVVFHIASVDAAKNPPPYSTRALPGRRDANRCFVPPFDGVEGRRARELLELLEQAGPEALVDLHNNTGHSPAYGVGTALSPERLALTSLFSNRYMLSDLRLGTLVEATHRLCPSIVVECGRAGDAVADAVALAGLERYVTIEDIHAARADHMEILTRPIRVSIRPGLSLAFGNGAQEGADVTVRAGIDRHNFDVLPAGSVVGWLGPRTQWPFEARGAEQVDESQALFEVSDGVVVTKKSFVPIMMTMSRDIAMSDCLFYAMQRNGRLLLDGEP